MKKNLLSALLLLSLLLSGCGSRAAQSRFASFSEALAGRETLSFTAELRAEYPDRSVRFTLRYEKDAEGETVTVLAPSEVEGIAARIAPDSSALVYDGMILDLPPMDPYGLTPMSALPRLYDALAHGHPDSFREEDGMTVWRLICDDHIAAEVWFDGDMIPLRCELASDENVCIFCELSDWS